MVSDQFIPYGRQHVTDEDIEEVVGVLRSTNLTQGPAVPNFEQALAKYCGAATAVCTNSATSALHLACIALGLGPGDRLWTSPITFVASANCALYCGAEVDFVDVDPNTYNMSIDALEKKLKRAKVKGVLPKIVVPVHLSGQPCNMREIAKLGKEYGFRIIEDASHAIGAQYDSAKTGNCEFSDITVFSFHPVKIITSAEGGAALTNDSSLSDRMARLRSHGITRDLDRYTLQSEGDWYYQQLELGFNYRMSDIHAALGQSQLTRIDDYVSIRNEIARRYNESLKDFGLQLPTIEKNMVSSFHLYIVLTPDRESRKKAFDHLRRAQIGVNVHYIPVHTQPYYKERGFSVGDYPFAEEYYDRAISLPIFPQLTRAQQEKVVEELRLGLR